MTDCGATNPFDYDHGNYVVQTFSQDSACEDEIVTTIGSVTDVCYVNGLSGSYSADWPYQYDYSDSICTENPAVTLNYQSFGCSLQTEDDAVYAYDSYVSYSHVKISSSSGYDGLSDEEIGGIVGGIVIVVFLLFAGIFMYSRKKKESMGTQEEAL